VDALQGKRWVWLEGPSIDWFDWLTDLVGWLVGWLVSWLVD
jgi:hypothetical protein